MRLHPTFGQLRVLVGEKLPILVVHAKHDGGWNGFLTQRRKNSSVKVFQAFSPELLQGTGWRYAVQHLKNTYTAVQSCYIYKWNRKKVNRFQVSRINGKRLIYLFKTPTTWKPMNFMIFQSKYWEITLPAKTLAYIIHVAMNWEMRTFYILKRNGRLIHLSKHYLIHGKSHCNVDERSPPSTHKFPAVLLERHGKVCAPCHRGRGWSRRTGDHTFSSWADGLVTCLWRRDDPQGRGQGVVLVLTYYTKTLQHGMKYQDKGNSCKKILSRWHNLIVKLCPLKNLQAVAFQISH